MDHIKVQLNEKEILKDLIDLRRKFHKNPELGWLEFETANEISEKLFHYGFKVSVGNEVITANKRFGLPNEDLIKTNFEKAKKKLKNSPFIDKMKGGLTGVIGTIGSGSPVTAFRFDIDALPIQEEHQNTHKPYSEQFHSTNANISHACGHDGHTSIGLSLAKTISENKDSLKGTIKLIFQPAEEGCRGAYSMIDTGVVDDVDTLICMHLGLMAKSGMIVAGAKGFLASTKYEAQFIGHSAHAGLEPEKGRNAILAAASATLQLHAIERHSSSETRVNVGKIKGGSGINVIADQAAIQFEVRASTDEGLEFLENRVSEILKGVSITYGVDSKLNKLGFSSSAKSDDSLIKIIRNKAKEITGIKGIVDTCDFGASEDATFFINKVQRNGGHSAYLIIGSDLTSGHHTSKFDFDEESMLIAYKLMWKMIQHLNSIQ